MAALSTLQQPRRQESRNKIANLRKAYQRAVDEHKHLEEDQIIQEEAEAQESFSHEDSGYESIQDDEEEEDFVMREAEKWAEKYLEIEEAGPSKPVRCGATKRAIKREIGFFSTSAFPFKHFFCPLTWC
jgi:hypothetical protein